MVLKENKPMYFASKALQLCQKKYVAIELEAIAVSWAKDKIYYYLHGRHFSIETDQKSSTVHDFKAKHIKGNSNILADCVFQAVVTAADDRIQLHILQVHEITKQSSGQLIISKTVTQQITKDDNIVLLKHIIQRSWLNNIQDLASELHTFWTFH